MSLTCSLPTSDEQFEWEFEGLTLTKDQVVANVLLMCCQRVSNDEQFEWEFEGLTLTKDQVREYMLEQV